ncbi:MAG: flagellar basal body L-ring protein FlgH [Acidobacteria bacterium]|nr:flagellar basal body L-ring protein FlgH [Acidobacteriota bacterium]
MPGAEKVQGARRNALAGVLLAAAMVVCLEAQPQNPQKPAPPQATDNYNEMYQRYLESARALPPSGSQTPDIAWMISLASDPRASRVNDLVTVRVIESIVAVGSADSSLAKSSSGSASAANFFGLEDKLPSWLDPTNLANASSKTDFQGSGKTTRTGELTATITARVVEVLPNGDLVLEGAREIDINGDRQIVVLTGVVRQTDIAPHNVVFSTSIGQLRIRYFGRGLIKDNLQPGWLIRILNKIF